MSFFKEYWEHGDSSSKLGKGMRPHELGFKTYNAAVTLGLINDKAFEQALESGRITKGELAAQLMAHNILPPGVELNKAPQKSLPRQAFEHIIKEQGQKIVMAGLDWWVNGVPQEETGPSIGQRAKATWDNVLGKIRERRQSRSSGQSRATETQTQATQEKPPTSQQPKRKAASQRPGWFDDLTAALVGAAIDSLRGENSSGPIPQAGETRGVIEGEYKKLPSPKK